VKAPQINTPPADHGVFQRRPRKSMVAEIEEPDFVKEEREAWSKKSPKPEIDTIAPAQPPSYLRATRASYLKSDISLQTPKADKNLIPQPRKQSKQVLPLRDFTRGPQEADIEDRPKTSRGPDSFGEDDISLRSSEDSQANATTQQKTRRSRFLEGSLNERSGAVASSWYDQDALSEDSYDSDATPRASKDTRGSSSFESNESKPLPITPATVKRKKLFKLKSSSIKPSEETEQAPEPQEKPKRRGLRKSMSTWNFNLGDKMKIFGASTNDLTPKAPKPSRDHQKFVKTPAKDSMKDVMDERKRKAEEAYSQQFVLKKQKSNFGIANPLPQADAPVPTKPSSLKRRTPSSSTRTSSASFRNRTPSSNTTQSYLSDLSASESENSKRLSRKELEKENQNLRNMLRQSSITNFDAHRSSVHLPLDEGPSYAANPQDSFAQGHKLRISPGKRMGRRGEDVPPVPKLSREVLGSLENGWHPRPKIDGKGLLPRPVSMILEMEEECKEGNEVENGKMHMQMSSVREQWEWPDDVF
jgi:hypothetical protein